MRVNASGYAFGAVPTRESWPNFARKGGIRLHSSPRGDPLKPLVFRRDFLARRMQNRWSRSAKVPHTVDRPFYQHEEIDLNCEVSSYANAEL